MRAEQHNPFRDQLAFWVGPILGALLAGGVYNALIAPAPVVVAHENKPQPGAALFRSKK